MGEEDMGLYLLLVGGPQFLMCGYRALLPDQSLHSGGGSIWQGSTEGYPAPSRGGWLTPLMRV